MLRSAIYLKWIKCDVLSRAVELLLDVTSPANGSKLSMRPLTCLCMENLIKWLHWSVTLEGVLMGVSHIWQSTLFLWPNFRHVCSYENTKFDFVEYTATLTQFVF